MKEQNLDIQSKGIEKKAERTIEEIIIKDENCKKFGEIAIVVEWITGILLPVIIGLVTGREMINVHLCIVLSSVTIITYTISLYMLEERKRLDGEYL